jgi:acyl carrier protein
VVHTEQQIYGRLRRALIDLFEIEADAITMDAHLADDLDIDSIDAVDLIGELRDLLPRKVEPEEFRRVATVRDVVLLLRELSHQ